MIGVRTEKTGASNNEVAFFSYIVELSMPLADATRWGSVSGGSEGRERWDGF